ncbi:glycosyltransferase [Streptomyces formicae]|uniref:Trehalose synthase n=1 Tax=Streptomyces formicae TaxID=1616117 RepID=A0A291Q2I5_9ACTN|nr:glycosyltransferase [Streptomyces formicae]ATL25718.1 Trehalose synthase [Streptomyces formicae]
MSVSLVDLPPAPRTRESAAPPHGRTVWHINTTAHGGGVAELLRRSVPAHNAAGVPAKWLALGGDAEFFAVTKRLHHRLHGFHDPHGALGADERRTYADATGQLGEEVLAHVAPGDLCVLHDPQSIGLAPALSAAGIKVVWRCHIGSTDHGSPEVRETWEFLRPYLDAPLRCVFSVDGYAPPGLRPGQCVTIPPSIDPAAAKNRSLTPDEVTAALRAIGLEEGAPGTTGSARSGTATVLQDAPLPPGAEVVVQVSRWDPLKDMAGVLAAFAERIAPRRPAAHLVLAGPEPLDIPDDPEGAEIFAGVHDAWAALPAPVRARVHLVKLTLKDTEGNALLVNALQRRADVIAQKSLREGFGLTVNEAMWKGAAIVASRVGGIPSQLRHEREGLLLADAHDGEEFAAHVLRLLANEGLRKRLGDAARQRCAELFLAERELADHYRLYQELWA